MRPLLAAFLVTIPLLPLLTGFAVRRARPQRARRLATGAAILAATAAGLLALCWILGGTAHLSWQPWAAFPALAVAFRLDAISAVMTVLVASLGAVVLRFSHRYLAGDPAEGRYYSWMSLTLGSVLTLVLSGHLLMMVSAWVSTSLCLHRLLLHYPDRAGAVFSARKKFVFSRLGDACLLAASVLLHRAYGSWDIETVFQAMAAGATAGLTPVGFLLVACAALKSAQFPFHSWLPDTMETPTPVSAFMHAGIVNAGGFLLVRFSPLLVHTPAALHLIALVGAFTAAFGAVVMLAQPSVKRALAYSTVAQMGFMLLQCGLGAFGLALLHLVAHALYKAFSFLRAGSTVGAVSRAAIVLRTPAITLGIMGGALIASGVPTLLAMIAPTMAVEFDLFAVVLGLALAYGLARAGSAGGGIHFVIKSMAAACAIGAVSVALHAGASRVTQGAPVAEPPAALLTTVAAVFAALFLFQALLWRAGRHPLGRALYLHALNGFYVGTLANRLLARLWPREVSVPTA